MDVIDSSKHLAAGKVKDASYLAKQIMPVMMKVDPQKDCFDLVAFDGAANVQKAGRIIQAQFPKVEVIEGVAHLGSLFLSKCFNESCLQLLKTFIQIVSVGFLFIFSIYILTDESLSS